MKENDFLFEMDKAMESLGKLSQSMKDLPDPKNYFKEKAIGQVEEVIIELRHIKKEIDDLESTILPPLNRAERRASEKKIHKLAKQYKTKNKIHAEEWNPSQK